MHTRVKHRPSSREGLETSPAKPPPGAGQSKVSGLLVVWLSGWLLGWLSGWLPVCLSGCLVSDLATSSNSKLCLLAYYSSSNHLKHYSTHRSFCFLALLQPPSIRPIECLHPGRAPAARSLSLPGLSLEQPHVHNGEK